MAFFGGEKAFARTQEQEHRKLGKCAKQGWRMSYVREGYDFAGLIANIIATP
ncbi:hypothetical protein [Sphingobium sp. B2]|uniref:hypothetical protein n=1 Tax=Sphingobium sp. B2 TaxID=2583228 RepID=UPI001643A3B0|nr:hypothetical protein [Sphingobium sp. B2]